MAPKMVLRRSTVSTSLLRTESFFITSYTPRHSAEVSAKSIHIVRLFLSVDWFVNVKFMNFGGVAFVCEWASAHSEYDFSSTIVDNEEVAV